MPRTSRRRSTYNYDVAEIAAMKERSGMEPVRGSKSSSGSSNAPRRRLSTSDEDDDNARDVQRQRRRRRSSSPDSGVESREAVGQRIKSQAPRSVRKERRFEDVVSDDDSAADAGGMTAILQKSSSRHQPAEEEVRHHSDRTSRNGKAVKESRRPPRQTFHEEAGDDGFIFSTAGPSSPRQKQQALPESKGQPPKQRQPSQQQQSSYDETESAFRPMLDTTQAGPSRSRDGQRATSDSHQATRRASILKDGAPAYPHPSIADDDLYKHCSSTLAPDERLRHLVSWTLERAVKNAIVRASDAKGKAKENSDTLRAAMRDTLKDLGAGRIEGVVSSDGKDKSRSSKRKPHPRNEANKRIATQLERTIAAMERELATWQRAQADMDAFEQETKRIEAETLSDEQGEGQDDDEDQLLALLDSVGQEPGIDEQQEAQMDAVRRALGAEAPWLLDRQDRLPSGVYNATRLSAEARYGTAAEEELARHVADARKRGLSEEAASENDGATPPPEDLLGTALDPRWHDVEFRSDVLASKAHILTQLSRMADRYTTAVSSRGAQAISDLVSGGAQAGSGTTMRSGASSSSDTAKQTDDLDRILAGVRQLDEGQDIAGVKSNNDTARISAGEDDEEDDDQGNVSDGDLLRAFVGLSRKR